MQELFDLLVVYTVRRMAEGRRHKRKVCGKPHRTESGARRGRAAAERVGWTDVAVEWRDAGYWVVTGIAPFDFARDEKPLTAGGLRSPSYRWSTPPQRHGR